MNLQQLEYFKIIAETKNFTTASEILSVTQPALSKAISKLEEELDVKLFQRDEKQQRYNYFNILNGLYWGNFYTFFNKRIF